MAVAPCVDGDGDGVADADVDDVVFVDFNFYLHAVEVGKPEYFGAGKLAGSDNSFSLFAVEGYDGAVGGGGDDGFFEAVLVLDEQTPVLFDGVERCLVNGPCSFCGGAGDDVVRFGDELFFVEERGFAEVVVGFEFF